MSSFSNETWPKGIPFLLITYFLKVNETGTIPAVFALLWYAAKLAAFLIIDLGIDIIPSIAFSRDPPESFVLHQNPIESNKSILYSVQIILLWNCSMGC